MQLSTRAQAGHSPQAGPQPPADGQPSMQAPTAAVQPAQGELGAPGGLQQQQLSGAAGLPPAAAAALLERQASVPLPDSPSKRQGMARVLSLPAIQQAAAAAAVAAPVEAAGRGGAKRRRTGGPAGAAPAADPKPKALAAPKAPASAEEQERKRQVCPCWGLVSGGAGCMCSKLRYSAGGWRMTRPHVPPPLPCSSPHCRPAWRRTARPRRHPGARGPGLQHTAAVGRHDGCQRRLPPVASLHRRPHLRPLLHPAHPCTWPTLQAAPAGPDLHPGGAGGGAGS